MEQDFMYCAETYGKIIISERFVQNKTIKPVTEYLLIFCH